MANDKKPNAVSRFFRETMGKLRKVSWPTWPEARQLTIIVITVMIAMGVYLALVDGIGERLIKLAVSTAG